jgi:DNA-binding IclR family transcriptional regulator
MICRRSRERQRRPVFTRRRLYASVSGDRWQSALEPDERRAFVADIEELHRQVPLELFDASWTVGLASPPAS